MIVRILSGSLALLLLAVFPASGQTFAITATNVVMPRTGSGTSQYTVSNVPETGTLTISCTNAAPIDPSTKVPFCYAGPPHAIPVVAGQTVTGTISFYPYPVPLPATATMAAALMIGVVMRRKRRWLVAVIISAALAGTMALSGCGGSSNGMTPGTYQFTVSAVNAPAVGTGPDELSTTVVSVKVQ
jgi:hypothetical protein